MKWDWQRKKENLMPDLLSPFSSKKPKSILGNLSTSNMKQMMEEQKAIDLRKLQGQIPPVPSHILRYTLAFHSLE